MNCKNAQSLLSAYLDDELSGREMLDIREHLSECAACAEELQCIESVKRMLGGTPVPEPSDDFEERLVSHVLCAAAPAANNNRRASIMALTGIAAVSMLLTMLVLNSLRAENPVAEQRDAVPYDLMERNRAFEASGDPLIASPVMSRR